MTTTFRQCAGPLLVALALLYGPASPAAAQPRIDELVAVAAAAIAADDLQPIRDIEARSIPASGGHARRSESLLALVLASGKTMDYADRPECQSATDEARCEQFRLVAYIPETNSYLIAHLLYEDLKFVLLDGASGAETEFPALPLFSPSGQTAITLYNNANAGSEVGIWSRQGHAFQLDWSGSPAADGITTIYALDHWASDSEIVIHVLNQFDTPTPDVASEIILHRIDGQWHAT